MKQRLIKVICCIALSVSVFLFNGFTVLGADALGKFDGSIVFTPSVSYPISISSSSVMNDDGSVKYYANHFDSTVLIGYLTAEFEREHIYTGTISFSVPIRVSFQSPNSSASSYWSWVSIGSEPYTGTNYMSFVDGAFLTQQTSVYNFTPTVYITFTNFTVSQTVNLRIPIYASFQGDVCSDMEFSSVKASFTPSAVYTFSNDLYDDIVVKDNTSAQYYISEQTTIIEDQHTEVINQQSQIAQQEMQQQQQIADQQSQQSAQQHDNLVNGYDNAANDNMLADKNSVLQGFEQQQDQAISGGQQYVADYSSGFSTAPLQAMAPAFMMISTWFNDLWSGMGNFSTVLVVGLMLCVAGYILKLKH